MPRIISFFATVTIAIAIATAIDSSAIAGPSEDALRVGQESFDKKDYSAALTTWVNAYNERATADTANDETCAKLLTNAASLLAQTGRYSEAAKCYENLLSLRTKLGGGTSPEAFKVKALLAAQISNAGGDIERAEKLARESVEGLEKVGEERMADRMLAITNLAGILFVKKDRLAAHELYVQVVALHEKHPKVAPEIAIEAYNSMGSIADFFGRTKDKIQYVKKALEVARKNKGADDPATYLARIELGSAYSAAGLNADAKSTLESIVADLDKKSPSADDKLLQQRWAASTYRLACIKSALGEQDDLLDLLKKALAHTIAGWGDLDPNALPIYLDLARLNITKKNYPEGVKCYQKVLDIRRRQLGPDHEDTKLTQKILNDLLEDVRKAQAAEK